MNGMLPERIAYLGKMLVLDLAKKRALTEDEIRDIDLLTAPNAIFSDMKFISERGQK